MKNQRKLNSKEAFDAMYLFLERYLCEKADEAHISFLLPEISRLTDSTDELLNPSRWTDWQKCIQHVISGKMIDNALIDRSGTRQRSSSRSPRREIDLVHKLKKMESAAARDGWSKIENRYFQLNRKYSRSVALSIRNVNLTLYIRSLATSLAIAHDTALAADASALYFEYDIDNDWKSAFFVCPKLDRRDPDWPTRWTAMIKGPSLAQFSRAIGTSGDFCASPKSTAVALHLIARTTCALGKAAQLVDLQGITLTMGFHDQDPITTLKRG